MKPIITLAIFLGGLLTSALVVADCTINRNVDIIIIKPDSLYTDHADGTVTDKETGLMWQKCSLGLSGSDCATGIAQTLTWQAALASASDNSNSGYTDWRLPNEKELVSIMEDACSAPPINDSIFPGTVVGDYWLSSPSTIIDNAWYINFDRGYVTYNLKNVANYVRLVRGGL